MLASKSPWNLYSELLIEYKIKRNKAAEGQISAYCDDCRKGRIRYGVECTGLTILFWLVDENENAHRVENHYDEQGMRLLYLMLTRASYIPYVPLAGKQTILSVTKTNLVLGRSNNSVVKLPIRFACEDPDQDGFDISCALIDNEIEISEMIESDSDPQFTENFVKHKRLFPDAPDTPETAAKRRCVEICPRLPNDLSEYLSLTTVEHLSDFIDAIRKFHGTGYGHNDLRIQNVVTNNKGRFVLIDYAFAKRFGQRFTGGGYPYFVDRRNEKVTSRRSDIGMFMRSILHHLVGDRHSLMEDLNIEYAACDDAGIYDFAKNWLRSFRYV